MAQRNNIHKKRFIERLCFSGSNIFKYFKPEDEKVTGHLE